MPRLPQDIPDSTLRILMTSGIGPTTYVRLQETMGDHDSICNASLAQLRAIDGVGRQQAELIRSGIADVDPDAERRAMEERNVRLILSGDDDYPSLLAMIPDPPPALWMTGDLSDRDRLAVAIVGSRKCTPYGREQTGRFAALLAECGLTIVSGGAYGIDSEAHRAALRVGGRTIAVLGSGLARPYPPEHEDLFNRIADGNGAVVSEFPMHTEPKPGNFPRRNRIISGLALGVLVAEAASRSGALITARTAAEDHQREAMAIPGRIDSPASAGCLQAIREGWAALVTNHADVLEQLDSSSHLVRGALEAAGHDDARHAATLFDGELTDSQRSIIRELNEEENYLLIDQLAARTGIAFSTLMADLTILQVRGRVQRDHRGVYLKR